MSAEFSEDAQAAYVRGNNFFKDGDFDAASTTYGYGARICPQGELKTKLLLNKALCDLKLRLHDSVIKDCSKVLQYEPHNVKALLRRASAYEYASEFKKGLADVEMVLSLPSVAPSLTKTATSLSTRLNLLCRQDERLQRSNTTQPEYLITNVEQCLRLNILDCDCADECGGGYLIVNVRRSRGLVNFKVCIGNEFGLWNRKWMQCRLCSGSDGSGRPSGDLDTTCVHMPRIRCEMMLLMDGSGGQIGRCEQVGAGALNIHGKADICMKLHESTDVDVAGVTNHNTNARIADPFVIAMFKFEIVSGTPDAIHGSMNNIISVISLPVKLSTSDPTDGGNMCGCTTGANKTIGIGGMSSAQSECAKWLSIGSRVHAQSIREVILEPTTTLKATGILVPSAPIYVLESPGYLGIGGKVWDSSYVLLAYLFNSHLKGLHLVNQKQVLELGSGTGVTGLALGALAPASLYLTDLAEVVPLLEDNVELNMLMRTRVLTGARDEDKDKDTESTAPVIPIVSLALPWGMPLTEVVTSHTSSLNITSSDSSSGNSFGGSVTLANLAAVDTIVASDVIYDPLYYEPLRDTLHHLLMLPSTCGGAERVCVLAHRHRHPEDHKFFDMMAASAELYMRQIPYEYSTMHGDTLLKDVKIFHIGRK